VVTFSCSQAYALFPTPQDNTQTAQTALPDDYTAEEIDSYMASLEDEDVRKLLQQELKGKIHQGNETLEEDVPGPGSLLGDLLSSLMSFSSQSEGEFKYLTDGLPNVIADLHKVFISL